MTEAICTALIVALDFTFATIHAALPPAYSNPISPNPAGTVISAELLFI